jgi:uncharacterized protein (TIGR02145 family)
MKTKIIIIITFLMVSAMYPVAQVTGTFTDSRDGKEYKTVKIDDQTWMAENLAYKADSGCWAYNNDGNNVETYGYLYKWETANKVCPKGWHLPADEEWAILADSLGGEGIAGKKMMIDGSDQWYRTFFKPTNESNFSGLPAGYRDDQGDFAEMRIVGDFWTSTPSDSTQAFKRRLSVDYTRLHHYCWSIEMGLSVRCLKDE